MDDSSHLAPGASGLAPDPIEMERGTLRDLIENQRGHCSRITEHYVRIGGARETLVSRVPPDRLKEIDERFSLLGTADGDLFRELGGIGEVMTGEAAAQSRACWSQDNNPLRANRYGGPEEAAPPRARAVDVHDHDATVRARSTG